MSDWLLGAAQAYNLDSHEQRERYSTHLLIPIETMASAVLHTRNGADLLVTVANEVVFDKRASCTHRFGIPRRGSPEQAQQILMMPEDPSKTKCTMWMNSNDVLLFCIYVFGGVNAKLPTVRRIRGFHLKQLEQRLPLPARNLLVRRPYGAE